jgi:uncharacterized protein with von Willebrand factor type A (vWA) domain
MPGETRGIHRSDRIARMLPAEAMLLGHPRLRLVWHARRAERSLLCYEDDDRMTETRLHQAPVMQPRPGLMPAKRLEMGPMLVCVDTSGSMQGGAEGRGQGRGAGSHARRPCAEPRLPRVRLRRPGGSVEMELPVDRAGIERATRFLGQSFRGGTDICGTAGKGDRPGRAGTLAPADLLIATDGEFGATPASSPRGSMRSSANSACACRAC